MVFARGGGSEAVGSCRLTGTEFSVLQVERVLAMGGGGGSGGGGGGGGGGGTKV